MIKGLVFFSGGTALRPLSLYLAKAGVFSSHLISVFDSGGSSAVLRRTFAMPAVGDLRNRILALADPETSQEVLEFCNLRLPPSGSHAELKEWLEFFASLSSPHWQLIPKAQKQPMWLALRNFIRVMPEDFDLRNASLGNLMLAGIYLRSGGDLLSALAFFSQLLHIRGEVLPITLANAHLGAKLENGRLIVGQHQFANLPAPVRELFLSVHESGKSLQDDVRFTPCHPPVYSECVKRLEEAALICFPMGSFYSSLLANLLVGGVGWAVSVSRAPKVFIPNSGTDCELAGLDVPGQVEMILKLLRADNPEASQEELLNYVLVDSHNGVYAGGMTASVIKRLEKMGLQVVNRALFMEGAPERHLPELLLPTLLSLSRL